MNRTAIIVLAFLTMISLSVPAQEGEDEFSSLIESLLEDENEDINYEDLEDQFEEMQQSPIPLNSSSAIELLKIPFINETDAQNIINHRKKYGSIQTLYELKHIPGFTSEKINSILPFVLLFPEKDSIRWGDELRSTSHLVRALYHRGIQQKKGYIPDSTGATKYLGDPTHSHIIYQAQTKKHLKIGVLAEKDAGEMWWRKGSGGFDFKSAHFQISNLKAVKQVNIGDYKVSYGQGLVVGTSSLLGKSGHTVLSFSPRRGMYKYASTNESEFLRGAGITLSFKHIETAIFASHKKRDANLKNGAITTFKTDGLHRTEAELEKMHNITESIIGGNLTYKKGNFNIGATAIFYRYSDTLRPQEKAYNHYKIKETNQHFNIGIDYQYVIRRIRFFGETAIDANLGFATINGISLQPNSRMAVLAIQRMYQPEYQSNYGNAFGENSRNENESGLYIGARILPLKKITLSLYADVYKFPWAKYNINQSTTGEDILALMQIKLNQKCEMEVKAKHKSHPEQATAKQTLRYTLRLAPQNFQLKTVVEANKSTADGTSTYGWTISNECLFKTIRQKVTFSVRHAYFNAENYNNRFYIYERSIPYSFSMPLLYGEGHRISSNVRWNITREFQLNGNFATYIYTDGRETIGSSNETIDGNLSSAVKILLICKFK